MVERHDDHNGAAQKINGSYPDFRGSYPGFSDGLGCIHIPNIRLIAIVLNPILATSNLFTKQGRFVSTQSGSRTDRKMRTCPNPALQVLLPIQHDAPEVTFWLPPHSPLQMPCAGLSVAFLAPHQYVIVYRQYQTNNLCY